MSIPNPHPFSTSENFSPVNPLSKPAVTPTLVIGLGGTGTKAVRALKRRLIYLWHGAEIEERMRQIPSQRDEDEFRSELEREYAMDGGPSIIRLLALDTLPWSNPPGAFYLNRSEYVNIGGYNANTVLKNLDHWMWIKEWWRPQTDGSGPGQIHSGARQIRAIGRLSFYRHFRKIWRTLKPQIDAMQALQAEYDTEERGYLVNASGSHKRVYVISSLCGGTGAGCILDMAATLRTVGGFDESAFLTAMLAMPSVYLSKLDSDIQKSRIRANAYAGLKEINHFMSHPFDVWLPEEKKQSVNKLYDRVYVVENENEETKILDQPDDIFEMMANQIFLESITNIGEKVWEYDVNVTTERKEQGGRTRSYILSSFANSRLSVPREDLLRYCELDYMRSLLSEGLLVGLDHIDQNQVHITLSGDLNNSLNIDIEQDMNQFRALATGRGIIGAASTAPAMTPYMDDPFAESSQGAPLFGANPAEMVTAQTAPQQDKGMLEELQKRLTVVLRKYGFVGGLEYIRRIRRKVNELISAGTGADQSELQSIEQLEQLISTHRRRRPNGARFLANLFGWLPPVRDPAEARIQQWEQDLSQWEQDLTLARTRNAQGVDQRSRWSLLQRTLNSLEEEIGLRRIPTLQSLIHNYLGPQKKRVFDGRHSQTSKMFELDTRTFGPAYIRDTIYPTLNRQVDLKQNLAADVADLMQDPEFCQLELGLEDRRESGTEVSLQRLRLRAVNEPSLRRRLERQARRTMVKVIPPETFHMLNAMQTSTLQIRNQLRNFFDRCKPFWRINMDLGAINETDLEEVIFAGVEGSNRKEWKSILRDDSDFPLVETGDPTCIEATRIRHGLPVEYIRDLEEYKRLYEEFKANYSGTMMHLDHRWESGAQPLDEIVINVPTDKHDPSLG